MRKTISTILVLVMVLSVFTSFGVSAEHWAQPSIDFVTQNGYWIAPEPINPDKVATRAETASLFARVLISKIPEYNGAFADVTADNIYAGDITAASLMGLMVGNEGYFRPFDTLTREELAAILDRASKMVSDEFIDTEWNMEFYRDGDDVSEWASQSVQNATKYVLMKGKGDKLFDPKGTVTIGEVATVVTTLADIADSAKATSTATSRDLISTDNIQKDFDVIQSGGINDSNGYCGYGMMVRFDGAPGDIYVSRKTSEFDASVDHQFAPGLTIVKVVDPNGNTVIRENMYYKDAGLMEKIISIPDGEPGIYRIVFTTGQEGDICTIGVKNPVSWGIYGDTTLYYTQSTPKKGYIYMPEKHSTLSIGIGGKGAVVSLWNEAGTSRIAQSEESTGTANAYRRKINVEGLAGDKVYMIQVPENFTGVFGFVGAPKIICPTAEMAWDLKGGIVYHTDKYTTNMEGGYLQLSGPIQVRARERMIEIYDELGGDFTVNFTKPELKEVYDNPKAESLLHSRYFHSVTNMQNTMLKQVTDPTSPWFGFTTTLAMQAGEEPWPKQDWQHYMQRMGPTLNRDQMVGALTINAETNAFYANPVLQKRVELQYLAWVVQFNETVTKDPYSPTGYGCNPYMHGTQTFELGDHAALMHGYAEARNWLSPETRAITDEGIINYCEVAMNCRGQGPNNQAMMGMVAAIDAYKATGMQHFLDDFENKAVAAVYPSAVPNYIGQTAPLGYWQEAGGSDGGSYGRMSEGMWDVCCIEYFTLPAAEKDPYVEAKMLEGLERFLKFDALFYCPPINGFGGWSGEPNAEDAFKGGTYLPTAAFTARVNSGYGGNSAIPGNTYLINYSPAAMRADFAATVGHNNPDTFINTASRTAAYICTNDAGAYWNIKSFWNVYEKLDHKNQDGYTANSSWRMYRAWHVPRKFEYKDLPYLPYELPGDYNIYDPEGGAIAIKHKGLYLMMYYDNNIIYQSGYSYLSSGPAQIWDEYFSTILSAQKPTSANNYKGDGNYLRTDATRNDLRGKFTEPEIVHTCILGTDAGGQLFAEAKEVDKQFKWIEEGKSFEISGIHPFNGSKIIWRYFLTDEGIEVEAGLETVPAGSNLYVQLPLVNITNTAATDVPGASLTQQGNSVVFAHNDKKTVISWDESVEGVLNAKLGEDSNYSFLQLKITPEQPMARFKFTREMGDYQFKPLFADYK